MLQHNTDSYAVYTVLHASNGSVLCHMILQTVIVVHTLQIHAVIVALAITGFRCT
jgi:hypothetical protein